MSIFLLLENYTHLEENIDFFSKFSHDFSQHKAKNLYAFEICVSISTKNLFKSGKSHRVVSSVFQGK